MEHQNVLERILEGSMKPTRLPLETLREITDEFSADRIIGEGGFGTVYKGVVGNRNVAVKRIKSNMTIDDKLFRREVGSLMDVNHQNIVRFLGLCSHTVEEPVKIPESRGYIYVEIRERLLCFEYISNGSLDSKITDELRGLEWDKRYQIIKGICAGLHYLHMEKHILHMDLKPANILLDNQMVPKITDFGLSRPTEESQTTSTKIYSSPGYGAPENMFGHCRMSVKSDMYSLGAIIIEIVTGRKAIPDNDNLRILRRWRHRWNKSVNETPLEYHQQVTECIEIGSLCLNIDAYARPSISQVMSKFAEMESTKIDPLYWDDDMLGVEPLELQFGYNKQQKISCSVKLTNDTDGSIAFNIQTTSPVPYSIEPNKDILKPRSKCSVDIELPFASAQGYKAALQYRTSHKQYSEEFIVQSIKVNEGLTAKDINQNMFDKYTKGHHVDEIHLTVVSEEPCSEELCQSRDVMEVTKTEEPSSKEVIDFPSKQAKKQYVSLGILWAPNELSEWRRNSKYSDQDPDCWLNYNKKVMLELTGGNHMGDWLSLDLVVVVDVSENMEGEKMEQLKNAMRFVVRKLRPTDRLAVVTFSHSATLLWPLRHNDEAWLDLEETIDSLRPSGRGTNTKDGLLTGLKVLADRQVSGGRVAGIMLMSAGNQSKGDATQVNVGSVPVYTFGLGLDSDPMVLNALAANSMGGTFSHIQDQDIAGGGLTIAFSQCLAGLLTVAVQDLELTVTAVGDALSIVYVHVMAGSYPKRHDDAGSVTVSFGNLYSREVRKFIVCLQLCQVDNDASAEILKVTCSYSTSSSVRMQFVAPPEMLTVWRTGGDLSDDEEVQRKPPPAELLSEEVRLTRWDIIKEAKDMANCKKLQWRRVQQHQGGRMGQGSVWSARPSACEKLDDARGKLLKAMDKLEQYNPLLRAELQELIKLSATPETYEKHGRAYALSLESSHCRQRFASRSSDIDLIRPFATPRMDRYLAQAKKFHQDPTMPLPSVDDDVKEEVHALMVDIDSREEEIERLGLDVED